MSHFSQVKTQIKDRILLKKVLEKLGHTVVDGKEGEFVRGYMGNALPAEFKILTDSHYDIGFQKDGEGNYMLVADWELMPRVSGIQESEFSAVVKREYAREMILQTAFEQGYSVEMEENEGIIQMVVTQW